MKFRIPLAYLICSIPLMAMPAAKVWGAGCPGRWVSTGGGGGVNCICPDGSWPQTNDLINYRCPTVPSSRNTTKSLNAKAPNDPSAEETQRAVKDEAAAEKELAAAEKTEQRTRKMLNDAKAAQEAANKSLRDANNKLDALQKRADATSDPQKKLKILREKLAVSKAMLPVVRGQDQIEWTISKLEGRLTAAKQASANARRKLEQARQARVAAVAKRSPASTGGAKVATIPQAQRTGLPPVKTPTNNPTSQNFKLLDTSIDFKPGSDFKKPDSSISSKLLPYAGYSGEAYTTSTPHSLLNDYVPNFKGSRQLGMGFRVETFVKKTGEKRAEVVAAFAGTDFLSPGDLVTDAGQLVMGGQYTEQYRQAGLYAADLGYAVTKMRSNGWDIDLTFTGHSLGGGLAQVASVGTVVKVDRLVTFNSAGLSKSTLNFIDNSVRTGGYTKPNEVIHARANGDPVSSIGLHLQGDFYQYERSGMTNQLRLIRNHKLGPLIELINEKAMSH